MVCKQGPIMLETLDPANRVPAAPDDQGRRLPDLAVATPPRVGQADADCPLVDAHACERSTAPGGSDQAAGPVWSSDWLQLSHELRTPLNAILGNIELLLDGSVGPLAAPVRTCVGDIQVASRQLLRELQPLLLLVQARTAGAPDAGPPLDLLALVRQAAADRASGSDRQVALHEDAATGRDGPRLPDGIRLMVVGDPVWLGALAAALVDLHTRAKTREPLSIGLERLGDRSGCCARGVAMRVSWPGLEPRAVSPLPLALIDAVLTLHGGRIRSLSSDGLRLDLPSARVVQSSTSDRGCR
jgi:phospho-acceptor domain-containing protein